MIGGVSFQSKTGKGEQGESPKIQTQRHVPSTIDSAVVSTTRTEKKREREKQPEM